MNQIRLNGPETLPTNGQKILLFLHDGTVCSAWFSNVAPEDGEYDWICCEDRFLIDGYDTHLIRGWLPLCYFEGFV